MSDRTRGPQRSAAPSGGTPPAVPAVVPPMLPKGGGAIRTIGETFAANPVTGTATLRFPLPLSPGRAGFGPQLALAYDSGAGNGPFGLGWSLGLASIARRTDRQIPRYDDARESDTFVLSGSDDLVPVLEQDSQGAWVHTPVTRDGFLVHRYRPRVEGLFARIERWVRQTDGDTSWRTITRDNVTTWYGRTAESRISDPADARRIFTWLICQSYDDKGNAVTYEYVPENGDRIFEDAQGQPLARAHERNRTDPGRGANRYLKRIRYGNRVPNRDANGVAIDPDTLADWMFEAVLDYDDGHYAPAPGVNGEAFASVTAAAAGNARWPARQDPFSTYRAGFEVRTYRLCRRILMFHRFPQELGRADCLVRAMHFSYDHNPVATRLAAVHESGYELRATVQLPDRYLERSFPPVELDYQQVPDAAALARLPVETVAGTDLDAVATGAYAVPVQWVDLDGEGAAGILSEHEGAWLYRRNTGASNRPGGNGPPVARFEPAQPVGSRPGLAAHQGNTALMDLAGDGQLDLVALDPATGGFHEHAGGEWSPFQPFASFPNLDTSDPNVRMIDLDGDGIAEIVVTADDALTWYPALGEAGFGPGVRQALAADDERGPRLVFSDASAAFVVADFSGDGSGDLARITNGGACYWPNLGYGRFGPKVTMDNAPTFDAADRFDPARIQLADTDGSGVADLIYLGSDSVSLWLNQSGNGWGPALSLPQAPRVERPDDVQVVDLLGAGTACLTWTSRHSHDAGRAMRYIDLMAGRKPHLLTGYRNGNGLEVTLEYLPSTYYAQQDRAAGAPWRTQLPFPVHCLSRSTTRDLVRDSRLVTTWTYHHGVFDGAEREFRGFGRIDQVVSESFARFALDAAANVVEEELHQPPVLMRTWFHAGTLAAPGASLLHPLAGEYAANTAAPEAAVPDLPLPAGLDGDETREAARCLKGVKVREERFALDGTSQEPLPYTTATSTYEVRTVQPRAGNRHAVFQVVPAEEVTWQYDRVPADPRITHTLILDIDELGQVRAAVSVTYPRRAPDPALPATVQQAQAARTAILSEIDYTNDVIANDDYRLRAISDQRRYDLTGLPGPAGNLLTREALRQHLANAAAIAYEDDSPAGPARRLIGRSQALYRRDDLTGPLPFGTQGRLGIVHEGYQLAFTSGLITQQFGSAVTTAGLEAAGYVHRDGDADWWQPSGTAIFPADAPARFYLPRGARDALGSESFATYDAHHLLVIEVVDPVGNQVRASHDYRFLVPVLVTDANGNRSAIALDPLGVVIAAAEMGKAGAGEGDTLDDPTERVEYDLFNWRDRQLPNYVHTFHREQHGAANPRFQERRIYTSGSGEPLLTKVQAEPGIARRFNPATGQVDEVDTTPNVRWVGNGRVILNNRGNPVKQFEPYFSATVDYEDEAALVETGVSFVTHYDPVDRIVRIDNPNGTFSRIEHGPWRVRRFDENDTVLESRWYSDRSSPDPAGPEPADADQRAAWLAAKHANTPSQVHSDSLGRTVYGLADNGGGDLRGVRTETDVTGRVVSIFDARDRRISTTFTNILATPIHAESAERGERWFLVDATGNVVRSWDDQNRSFRLTYDDLRRPLSTFLTDGNAAETLIAHTVYGEQHPDAVARNMRGAACLLYDTAGEVRFTGFDFKGNALSVERRFADDYHVLPDWSALAGLTDVAAIRAAADPLLEVEITTGSTSNDALNRLTEMVLADGTVIRPAYNEANNLNSLQAQIRGQGAFVSFLVDQDYDAKGRRERARFGNGAVSRLSYDPDSFALTRIETRLAGAPDGQSLQDLTYTYDAIGNIVAIIDDAQQTHYFNNAVVKPLQRFTYDPLYQLVEATGREHAGLGNDDQRSHNDLPVNPLPHPNNANAVRTYTERYTWDNLGNLSVLQHIATGGGWTQRFRYAYEQNPADRTNRLAATSLPGDPDTGPFSATYSHDMVGNMTAMPHLATMGWNALDQLQRVDLGGGGVAFYVYGNSGRRLRKVIERAGGVRIERRSLGATETYREFTNAGLRFERETLFISDDHNRIAQVDTKRVDTAGADPAALDLPVIRYQFSNHLGSAMLETDDQANVISYEEYHPFGSSAYRSAAAAGVSLKRFRFLGKERDDETGLYHLGARYYAPWLGRFTSADPAGFAGGLNLYAYGANNPVTFTDPTGTGPRKAKAGDVNPLNDVSWEVPKWVKTKEDFKKWLPPDNPDRPYNPDTLTVRTVKRNGKTVPVFRADFLDPKTQKPVLPRVGENGHVTSWGTQQPAQYTDPKDPSTRTTENEHNTPRAQQKVMGDEKADSKATPTVRSPKDVSDAKTKVDNQNTAALKAKLANGQPVDYVDEVVMKSNQNFQDKNEKAGTPIRPGSINRGTVEELNRKFGETKLGDVGDEIKAWENKQTPTPKPGGNSPGWSWGRVGSIAGGTGAELARGLIPGFVEAEMGALAAPYVVSSLGITNSAIVGGAAAVAAAPTATAVVVVGSAVGGYFVGDIVEEYVTPKAGRVVGVGAGTLAGAGTGALIGAAVGSVVPVLGTAVGAVVGGIVGGIAGFIGSFW